MEKEEIKEPVNETIGTTSSPLTFGELEVGEYFIDFPTDGDDSGHGGFRKGAYLFKKVVPFTNHWFENAFRLVDGVGSHMPDTMQVYKVIL